MADFAKDKAKKVVSHLLHKLADSFDDKKDDEQSGQSTPADGSHSGPPKPHGQHDLASSFNNLSLSGGSQSQGFVGGFHPNYNQQQGPYSSQSANVAYSTPYPSQPPYPLTGYQSGQQSSIMQMAMEPDESKLSATKPHKPTASHSPKPSKSSPPSTPLKPPRTPRKSSSTKGGAQKQCAGITKAGKQCTRLVKTNPEDSDSEDSDADTPKFCHQHSKEVLSGNSGFYSRKNGEWVKFDDWIMGYLQPETQVALRCEMERSRSQSDVPGYIYTFEIREEDKEDTVKLKVGRAVNLTKRMDQWSKQCGSKEQVLRGFYPGGVDAADLSETSLLKGRIQAGEKGPACHRLERLIHLELGDLVRSQIYLDAAWPNVKCEDDGDKTPSGGTKAGNTTGACPDCGSIHKEIFEFTRWTDRKHRGKEWELLVKPVVERWGNFVALHV